MERFRRRETREYALHRPRHMVRISDGSRKRISRSGGCWVSKIILSPRRFFSGAFPFLSECLPYDLTNVERYRYGVVVFFGFSQHNELDILDDLIKQEIMIGEKKSGEKKQYEIESFHFEYDPAAPTPRIYNDFFSESIPSRTISISLKPLRAFLLISFDCSNRRAD